MIAGAVLLVASALLLGICLGVFHLARFVLGKIRRRRLRRHLAPSSDVKP